MTAIVFANLNIFKRNNGIITGIAIKKNNVKIYLKFVLKIINAYLIIKFIIHALLIILKNLVIKNLKCFIQYLNNAKTIFSLLNNSKILFLVAPLAMIKQMICLKNRLNLIYLQVLCEF